MMGRRAARRHPHAQNNDPWRGGKQDHYDGGLRVTFLVRWPA